MSSQGFLRFFILVIALTVMSTDLMGDDRADFFERRVRPILVERCSGCHGANKQSGMLRVDSFDDLLAGGDTGPSIVPGEPDKSLIFAAVRRSEDLAMPPDEALSPPEVNAIRQWIADGAIWPQGIARLHSRDDDAAEKHWAFQKLAQPEIPQHSDGWAITPIDSFVFQELKSKGLSPAPRADRRSLIRRASYALTGLPPNPELLSKFLTDTSPDAWERLIDQLLNSKQYGEHWARHWLDIARYADTKGYVYAREERFWVHAWSYRDWVIDAINRDLPYDRFLLLQLAADQVDDRQPGDLAAMGFLTLGRRFLGVRDDIVDDRIDVVCRGTMGLTVACARCHDHKYDPIPTADYYSLYGVFDSCAEQLVPLHDDAGLDAAFQQELNKRSEAMLQGRRKRCDEASARIRSRVGEYLFAQTELHKYPRAGFDQIIAAEDLHPRIVANWRTWLYDARRNNDPVFRPWHEFHALDQDDFAAKSPAVTKAITKFTAAEVNPVVAAAFTDPPQSFQDVISRYTDLLSRADQQWQAAIKAAAETGASPPDTLSDPDWESLRLILYGPGSPCVIPNEHIANTEPLFDSGVTNELWKQQNAVDRWIIDASSKVPYAMTLVDRPVPSEPRVFLRGDPTNLGDPVSRGFLSFLSDPSGGSFQTGSGRKELAEAIIDPQNPLTARVIVNRVWMHLFGQGLVRTPSDFGLRAERPSHPELLDHLSIWFINNGWSLKKLQRLILTSAVFQQASTLEQADASSLAEEIDPDNRLLWRFNPHRMTFEEFRDSLLCAADEMDPRLGGKPFDLFNSDDRRRTIYGLVDRQYLPGVLRTFDFASPDLHVEQRSETTVPQQALFAMNHNMVLDRAKRLAKLVASQDNPEARVQELFRRILGRDASETETKDALQLVADTSTSITAAPPSTAADWSYGYGQVDEAENRVTDFQSIPHFTGTAWQGGPNWPDQQLGWVSLTAIGGHPGNTRQHACIRRWTAPRTMQVRVTSKLVHEAVPGDGIRGFVLTSTGQPLHAVKLHQDAADLNVDAISVAAGDQIDFVVDIDAVLNSDQFLWEISIDEIKTSQSQSASQSETPGTKWNSLTDFPTQQVDQLTPWEQLAHVLLCTNEFMFID